VLTFRLLVFQNKRIKIGVEKTLTLSAVLCGYGTSFLTSRGKQRTREMSEPSSDVGNLAHYVTVNFMVYTYHLVLFGCDMYVIMEWTYKSHV